MPRRKIPWTPEKLAAAQERGRRQGLINVQNGTLRRAAEIAANSRSAKPKAPRKKYPRKHVLVKNIERYRQNGIRTGEMNAKTGWMEKIRTRESAALGGRVTSHVRWHVERGITNPNCYFCMGEPLPSEKEQMHFLANSIGQTNCSASSQEPRIA